MEQPTMSWKNFAPQIIRQRIIIEGTTKTIVTPDEINTYLIELAKAIDMEPMRAPISYSAHELGFGGWIHWRTSGATFYSYPTTPALFTVDCYTCKPFSGEKACAFTKEHLHAIDIAWKEISIDDQTPPKE